MYPCIASVLFYQSDLRLISYIAYDNFDNFIMKGRSILFQFPYPGSIGHRGSRQISARTFCILDNARAVPIRVIYCDAVTDDRRRQSHRRSLD